MTKAISRAARLERVERRIDVAIVGTMGLIVISLCGAMALAFANQEPIGKRFEAITRSGEVYVIGSGDDCNSAWKEHGAIPADWRTLQCVDDI